jgi:hypothetical protein
VFTVDHPRFKPGADYLRFRKSTRNGLNTDAFAFSSRVGLDEKDTIYPSPKNKTGVLIALHAGSDGLSVSGY